MSKPCVSALQRQTIWRKHRSSRKAERTGGDAAIGVAVEGLLKAIREATEIIGRLPLDEDGRIRIYTVDYEGGDGYRKKTQVFVKFTDAEVRALGRAITKHGAAVWRLSAPIAVARDLWERKLAEYKGYKSGSRRWDWS
jgi:hypothetical protein